MELLREILEAYEGEPLEKGGTSISAGPAPAIKQLSKRGAFHGEILDYGSGKYARNANFLREQGFKVYAYDPYNGNKEDGWTDNSIQPPKGNFDVVFSAFVLNVVPEKTENTILSETEQFSKGDVYHITRNLDIFDTVKKALERGDKIITDFFLKEFASPEQKEALEENNLDDDTILDFCYFGTQTSRGFQRIPQLEDKGYNLTINRRGFKVYKK